jgi:hypothetical protein
MILRTWSSFKCVRSVFSKMTGNNIDFEMFWYHYILPSVLWFTQVLYFVPGLIERRQQCPLHRFRPEGLFQVSDYCGSLFMERFKVSNHHTSTQRWDPVSKCRYSYLSKTPNPWWVNCKLLWSLQIFFGYFCVTCLCSCLDFQL